MELVFC